MTPSSDIPDWSRESKIWFTWSPGKSLLSCIRLYQNSYSKHTPISFFKKKFAVFNFRFWSIVTGADIPLNSRIGGGLLLPHPNGIVIHPEAIIGPNCLIFQQVTIGLSGAGSGVPTIGGHVDIGAGAKVLGPVRVGNHVVIGANAVVLVDVPDYCIAVGVPAIVKPMQREFL